MPVQACKVGNKPGLKWGKRGKCYTYKEGDEQSKAKARKRAESQAQAAYANGYGGVPRGG